MPDLVTEVTIAADEGKPGFTPAQIGNPQLHALVVRFEDGIWPFKESARCPEFDDYFYAQYNPGSTCTTARRSTSTERSCSESSTRASRSRACASRSSAENCKGMRSRFSTPTVGREGMIARIREHCRLAKLFESWVIESENFEMMAPVPFALACFRIAPKVIAESELDGLNEKIMNDINASGEAYLSHTKLNGKFTIRLSVGSIRVEERHLVKVWELLNTEVEKSLK